MDYAKAFTFAFEEEGWFRKLGIAGLVLIIALLLFVLPGIFFLYGYLLRTARNVIDGRKQVLPDIDNIGEMFADGAKAFVAALVYALPMVVIYGAAIPLFILAEDGGGALGALGGLLYCVAAFYGIFLGLLQPAILVEYLRNGSTIGGALNFSNVIATFRENFVICLLFLLISIGVQFVVQIVTGIALITICGWILVIILGTAWTYAVQGHVIGQFYNELEGNSFAEKTPDDLVY